ncbi:uncharacterized protein LOC129592027 [Paramacrobiotus metropolitanus]|uniref:uncharacterized protein LOC129592027 n=1 Tax=Paramacrobiotus metropolitanus TaxID=2943436 RepID=UPI00244576BD|nr:uncharacterized protein LOC129592027 [Paramacrobiotus metropolitanus]
MSTWNSLILAVSCAAALVTAAPPGPTETQQPAKMQLHVSAGHPNTPTNHHNPPPSNPVVVPNPNINQQSHHEAGPVAAGATNYESYSPGYSGGGSNYGGGAEYSSDNYGFDCYGKKPALYGDANYDCRIYHVCQADGRSDTIKCPKWTRFNNYLGICDWHFKVDNYCNPLPDYKGDGYGSGYSQGGSGGYQQGGGGY